MTRDEAVNMMATDYCVADSYAKKWINTFEKLGMLKLDKPKPEINTEAVQVLRREMGWSELASCNIVATLYNNGFKVTRDA